MDDPSEIIDEAIEKENKRINRTSAQFVDESKLGPSFGTHDGAVESLHIEMHEHKKLPGGMKISYDLRPNNTDTEITIYLNKGGHFEKRKICCTEQQNQFL